MKQKWFYIIFLIPALYSCLDSPEMTTGIVNGKEKPTVLTIQAEPFVMDGHLSFHGEIKDTGKAAITEKGFFWSTVDSDPRENSNKILSSSDANIFSCDKKDASGDSTYYWRAFAKNIHGYDYGHVYSFKGEYVWEKKEELNANYSRGRNAVIEYKNKIYAICGEYEPASRPLGDAWMYDISENKWHQRDNFPGDERRYLVAFAIGNKIYAGTGQKAAGAIFNDLYQYDIAVNEWTGEKIDTPDGFEARYNAVAFSLNDKGYIVGGRKNINTVFNDVWQYDPENDSWNKKEDFPVNFSGGISISHNNRAFVGFNSNSELPRTLWEYDEANDRWEEFTTLPDEIEREIVSGVIVQNTIYILDEKNKIWTCDMNNDTKTWKFKTDLPKDLLNANKTGEEHKLLTTGYSNSIYVGLGFTKLLYEYRPLWDN